MCDAVCSCLTEYEGDPYTACRRRQEPPSGTYLPARRCGDNAIYKDLKNGNYLCECVKNFYGNPNLGCRPECVQNTDCPYNRACTNYKCVDPCLNLCGLNARCDVDNHQPICRCLDGYRGSPLLSCTRIEYIPSTPRPTQPPPPRTPRPTFPPTSRPYYPPITTAPPYLPPPTRASCQVHTHSLYSKNYFHENLIFCRAKQNKICRSEK